MVSVSTNTYALVPCGNLPFLTFTWCPSEMRPLSKLQYKMLLTKQTVSVHTKTKFLCSPRNYIPTEAWNLLSLKYMQYSQYHTYSYHGWLLNYILLQNISYDSERNKAVQITQGLFFFSVGKNNPLHCCLYIPVGYLVKRTQLGNERCPENPNSNIYNREECHIMLDSRSL